MFALSNTAPRRVEPQQGSDNNQNNSSNDQNKFVGPRIEDLTGEQQNLIADVQKQYTFMMESGLYKKWEAYPQFVYKFADYFVRYQSEPKFADIWEWGKSIKVPPDALRISAAGPGGGADSANTIRSFQTAILNRSLALGLTLDPETISYIARVAEAQNFSSEQLMQSIVELADFKKIQAGELTASLDEMRATANSYLLTVSDTTLQDYAKKLATGGATKEGIESYFKAQSKAMNPWLAQYIDAGIAPSELLKPSRDAIARSLGLSAADVNFTDARFLNMATVTDDKGVTRLANTNELMKNIRNDSAWASTDEARQTTAGMATILSRIFGRSIF